MANIKKIKDKYHIQIRKKGYPQVSRSFFELEDAEQYVYYKEKLMQNMKNFQIPIEDRLTLEFVLDKKIEGSEHLSNKTQMELKNTRLRLMNYFGKNRMYNDISLDEWQKFAHDCSEMYVYRGGKNENCKRRMSPETLRSIFAYTSSAVNFCKDEGAKLLNHPLTIMQTYITPLIRKKQIEKAMNK